MSRPSRCKVIETAVNDKEVIGVFRDLLNGDGPSLSSVYPKYVQLRDHSDRFVRLLEALGLSACLDGFPDVRAAVADYAAALRERHSATFSAVDLAAAYPPSILAAATQNHLADYDSIPGDVVRSFSEVYQRVTLSDSPVATALKATQAFLPHKASLHDMGRLRDRFLKSPGETFSPFGDLPELNFKRIYISDQLSESDQRMLLLFLHKFYKVGLDVYNAKALPEIDIQRMVQTVFCNLDMVKKQIPRCGEAFAKIQESVDLLENNFADYHKDYDA